MQAAKYKCKIKKSDTVRVISGQSRGKTGKILKIDLKNDRVVVEGINKIKRHTKPSQTNPTGGIVEKEASIHISNVTVMERSGKKAK